MSHTTLVFFFNYTATTEIYTLSLHDALPICQGSARGGGGVRLDAFFQTVGPLLEGRATLAQTAPRLDRKSTRLNSSYSQNSYDGFCLNKKRPSTQLFAALRVSCTNNNSQPTP